MGMEKESNDSTIDEFILESYKKYKVKKRNPKIFSSFSYQLPLYILAKSLSINSNIEYGLLLTKNPGLQNFINTCNLSSLKLESDIIKLADNYLLKN